MVSGRRNKKRQLGYSYETVAFVPRMTHAKDPVHHVQFYAFGVKNRHCKGLNIVVAMQTCANRQNL